MNDLFFVKKCLGINKTNIDVYKFRTMTPNAYKDLTYIIKTHPLDSLGKPLQDPRITPLGHFLRKYWIDEIPQLYNLAKGDLKLVGIRPRSEESWSFYPQSIMDDALKQNPGLLGIQYGFPKTNNFDDCTNIMDEYLYYYKQDPIKTDSIYLSKILKNILFNGARSK